MMLDEKHKKVAIEIVQRNRKKKSCGKCYDRGYEGFSSADNTIIPCSKCVDTEKAYEEWKAYVETDEQLKEDFKELFEEEEKTEETVSEADVKVDDHSKPKQKSTATKTTKTAKTVDNKPTMQRRSQGRGK